MLWADLRNAFVLATTAITAGYGVIGYLDDYLKIKRKSSGGLAGRYKLLGQFLIAGAVIALQLSREPAAAGRLAGDRAIASRIPFVAFAKHPIELPLALYVAVRGVRGGRHVERGEPHRRPRRPRDRPGR